MYIRIVLKWLSIPYFLGFFEDCDIREGWEIPLTNLNPVIKFLAAIKRNTLQTRIFNILETDLIMAPTKLSLLDL